MAAHVASHAAAETLPPGVTPSSVLSDTAEQTDGLANTRPAPLPTSLLTPIGSADGDLPVPAGTVARTSPIEPVVQRPAVKYVAQMDVESYAVRRGVMGTKSTWLLTLDGVLFSVFKNKSHGDPVNAKHTVNVRNHPVTVSVPDREITFVLPDKERPWKFQLEDEPIAQRWADALESAMHSDIEEFYRLGRTIGGGAFGNVVMAWDKRTDEPCAVKIIQRSPTSSAKSREHLEHEMDIMKRVDHPSVVRTYAIFNLRRTIYIAMELVPGGDLFDFIATQSSLTESQAIQVIRGILEAVDYLHRCGIVHRDLKPENILCVEQKWPVRIKLTDFGFSNVVDESGDRTMRTQVGTAYFMAPEILEHQQYEREVDCFACGVILYTMLTGRLPFPGVTTREYWMHVKNGNAKFPAALWEGINPLAQNLVKGLLNTDPKKRLTAFAALQHEWIWSASEEDAAIRRDRSNLHSGRRKLQKVRGAFWALTVAHKLRKLQEAAKIPEIVEAVGEGVKKTGEGIKTGVVKTGDGIEKGVKLTGEGVKKTGEVIGDGVKKTGEGIKTGVVKTADGIEKGVKVTVEGVEKGVKKTGEVIGEGVKKTGEGIKTGVDGIEKGVKKTVEGVEKGVKKTGEGVKKTGEVFGEGVKKTGEGVKKTGEAIGQGGKKTVGGIKAGVVKTADGIEKGVRKTGEGVKKTGEVIGSGVEKGVRKTGEGVKRTGEVIGNGVKKTGENVKRGGDLLNARARRYESSDERTGRDSSSGARSRSRRRGRRGSGVSSGSSVASRDRSSSASAHGTQTRRSSSINGSNVQNSSLPPSSAAAAVRTDRRGSTGDQEDATSNGRGSTVDEPSTGRQLAVGSEQKSSEYYSADEGLPSDHGDASSAASARKGASSAVDGGTGPESVSQTTGEDKSCAGTVPDVAKESVKSHPESPAQFKKISVGRPTLPILTGLPVGLSGDDENCQGLDSINPDDSGPPENGDSQRFIDEKEGSRSSTGTGRPVLPVLAGLPIGLSGNDVEGSMLSSTTVGANFGSNFSSIENQQPAVGAGSGGNSDALRKTAGLLLASSAAEEQRK